MARFRWLAAIVLLFSTGPAGAVETQAPPVTPSTSLLLPVYAVDVSVDASGGVDPKVWAELKAAGVNAVRFPVELAEGKAAVVRVAALCAWAQAEKVSLIPILVHSASIPLDEKLEETSAQFARELADTLRGKDPTAYTRILMFQVGQELNHPARNGRLTSKKAAQVALEATKALRDAERKALEANGLSPTPLAVSLSLDVPLLTAGAAAGFDLPEAAYGTAYAALRQDLAAAAASPDIDIVSVSWLAGSLSGGGAARFMTLLQSLATDVPGKQIVLVTGVSTAFLSPAEAEAFAKLTFANLAEYRSSGGADSPFIGVVFRGGLPVGAPQAPPSGFAEARAAWSSETLSQGVLAHWRGEKAPEATVYWLSEVEARFALLGTDGTTAALQGLKQVAGIVADPATAKAVAEAVAAPSPTPAPTPTPSTPDVPGASPTPAPSPTPGGQTGVASTEPGTPEDPGAPNPIKEKVAAAGLALLDQLLSKLTDEATSKLGGTGSGQAPKDGNVPAAAISIQNASCGPTAPKVQQKVTCQVNLRNASNAAAAGLSVALLDADDYLLGDETMVEGVAVPTLGQSMVPISWHPTVVGVQPIRVKVYDASYSEVGTAAAGQVDVKKSGSSKPPFTVTPGKLKVGFPWIGALAIAGGSMKTMSADGPSVGLPIANRSQHVMAGLTAALWIDGTRAASRAVPTLMPGQSRQIVFDRVRLAPSGTHDVRATLERAGTAPLAAGSLRLDGKAIAAADKRLALRTVPSVRPVLETERTALRPVVRATPVPGRPILAPTPPTTPPTTPTGQADLGFLGAIRLSPSAARVGQTLSVGASIVNRGTKASGGITVLFEVLDTRGHVGARGSRRLPPLAGRSQAQAQWDFTLPAGGPWRVAAHIQAPGDVSGGNNTTVAAIRTLIARPPRRR